MDASVDTSVDCTALYQPTRALHPSPHPATATTNQTNNQTNNQINMAYKRSADIAELEGLPVMGADPATQSPDGVLVDHILVLESAKARRVQDHPSVSDKHVAHAARALYALLPNPGLVEERLTAVDSMALLLEGQRLDREAREEARRLD